MERKTRSQEINMIFKTFLPAFLSLSTVLSIPKSLGGDCDAASKQPNSFCCINDNDFLHFDGAGKGIPGKCPGNCATRTPPIKNPCVGKANAAR